MDDSSSPEWAKFGGTLTLPLKAMEFDGLQSKTREEQFLTKLLETLPNRFTGLDASRPWIIYWCIHSLALMNVTLDPASRQRAAKTILSFQNPDGGFGGGIGQMPHLAPTYASIMALAITGDEQSWEKIDRRKMLKWLLSLKQKDGSFIMHHGGEVDVRGVYCALCVAVLLNILTPSLASGTEHFVISCQTYEGGLAAASLPYSDNLSTPTGEAHGGYAFCALASYHMLHALPYAPSTSTLSMKRSLDLGNLYRWAAGLQGLPIEGGGFRGRTNKLVDGCYNWWCGGLFPILMAEMEKEKRANKVVQNGDAGANANGGGISVDDDWEDEDEQDIANLGYDRVAAQEYVLLIAQLKTGGFRDKPGKAVDAYHTSSNLSGLCSSQHKMVWSTSLAEQLSTIFQDPYSQDTEGTFPLVNGLPQGTMHLIKDEKETEEAAANRMKENFIRALSWTEDERGKIIVGHPENELVLAHPIYNVTIESAQRIISHFYRQPLEKFSNLKGDLH
ncbi:terpenoid cyclases/Protein prenyltransferase [Atractiella rhizophila]|nr:terpenoid cyclases/Protein prenyltransferase [Atractiella rhizophila]